jgi:hypothetical protein
MLANVSLDLIRSMQIQKGITSNTNVAITPKGLIKIAL